VNAWDIWGIFDENHDIPQNRVFLQICQTLWYKNEHYTVLVAKVLCFGKCDNFNNDSHIVFHRCHPLLLSVCVTIAAWYNCRRSSLLLTEMFSPELWPDITPTEPARLVGVVVSK
jgi:hypothetical protein